MKTTSGSAEELVDLLRGIREQSAKKQSDEVVHVASAGKALSVAYEQLRNAAEYTDDHLLMQQSIGRFYQRFFLAGDEESIYESGEELITELTLAGYVPNDTVSVDTIMELNKLASQYYPAYQVLAETHDGPQLSAWITSVIAARAEALFNDHVPRDAFVQFAFETFLESIDAEKFFHNDTPEDYELLLYVAVHRALAKSNETTIRSMILSRFSQAPIQLESYVATNQKIDQLFMSKHADDLTRLVSRHGASLRILQRMLLERDDMEELVLRQGSFLQAYEDQVRHEYSQARSRINRGLGKSIVFLIITKFIVGLAAEVPYDWVVYEEILWLPLIVNLFAPILYMVSLGLTLTTPGEANTRALVDSIDTILYSESTMRVNAKKKQPYNQLFNALYGLLFVVIFGLVSWGLLVIGFSWLHLVIFFTFFSAASFLGFRLSRMIRDIEAVDSDQSTLAALRDFVYMPFVVLGRKINEGYSRVNFMAIILDMVIELPLKTLMRFTRQWTAFITAKKDEL